MKLSIYKSKTEWRWRVTSRNGRIVAASSEGFRYPSGAKRNLRVTLRHLVALVENV